MAKHELAMNFLLQKLKSRKMIMNLFGVYAVTLYASMKTNVAPTRAQETSKRVSAKEITNLPIALRSDGQSDHDTERSSEFIDHDYWNATQVVEGKMKIPLLSIQPSIRLTTTSLHLL